MKANIKVQQGLLIELANELHNTPKDDWKYKHIKEDYRAELKNLDAMLDRQERGL